MRERVKQWQSSGPLSIQQWFGTTSFRIWNILERVEERSYD